MFLKLGKKHTVHPTNTGYKPGEKGKLGAYGSWCTPDSSPVHSPIVKLNPVVQLRDDTIQNRANFELQKLRLFDEAISKYKDIYDGKDIEKEDPWQPKNVEVCEEKKPPPPEDDEKSLPPIEIPQSPVPISPSRCKKGKGLARLLSLCDLFLPIDPQGRGYILWLLLVTFCYSYNAWCIPLRATFPYQTPDNIAIWMTLDYLCDLVYLLDVAMVKPKLMYLHEGFWVDDPVETSRNYRMKPQFKFDVLSLLPLDLLYLVVGTDKVILRLPRLLKLQTFWRFHQAMDRVLSSPYVVRIGKTLFYIFFLIHLNACAYYAMSAYIGLGSNGWVYDNKGNAYIRCFYFATKTATSIGKNPKPENTIEYLFMTFAWLMGVFVFALLIGQIRDIIATATRARTEYRKRVDNCIRYLRRLNMPNTLQRRVTCWFNYTWNMQRCFDEQRILDSLPFNMKRDVALAVHMSTLSKVQLFRDCSTSLLRDLVLQLRPVSVLPGDAIVRRGDVGHHMYIVQCGECYVMSPDESEVLATLKEGSVFGEISLLGIDGLRRRTATVISRGYTNLFALSRHDLNTALQHHKEAAQVLRRRADQIIRENAARQTKQRLEKTSEETRPGLRRRRNSNVLGMKMDGRKRTTSSLSKRRLSVVSEDQNSSYISYDDQSRNTDWTNPGDESKPTIPTIVLNNQQ